MRFFVIDKNPAKFLEHCRPNLAEHPTYYSPASNSKE